MGAAFGDASRMIAVPYPLNHLVVHRSRVVRSKRVGPMAPVRALAVVAPRLFLGLVLLMSVVVSMSVAGLTLGTRRPATHFFNALVLPHCAGGTSGPIGRMGQTVALVRIAVRRFVTLLFSPLLLVGPRPIGSTSRILVGATAVSSCGICCLPNAGASNIATPTLRSRRAPRRLHRTSTATRSLLRRQVAQFVGGLIGCCSRLGRWSRLPRVLPLLLRQFVGTILRCLGLPPLARSRSAGGGRRSTSRPGTRIWLFRLLTTPSALHRERAAVELHSNLGPPVVWLQSANAWLLASPLPPPESAIRMSWLDRGEVSSKWLCTVTAATRASTSRRPRMRLRGTRSMRCPLGATASFVV